ncbi:MAG: hypothetical protein JNM76_05350 [Betaproteobacteria bacterium]|nr:hypothetical protein [Betaproteobacteria bacterium]
MHPFKSSGLTLSGFPPHTFRPFSRFISLLLLFVAFLFVGFSGQAAAAPFAYVTLGGSGKIVILDVATNTVVREITSNVASSSAVLSPSGRQLYLGSNAAHTVSVVDIASGTVTSTFRPMAADGFPVALAVHPNGSRLYVSNQNGELLSVIDLSSNLPIAQIPLIRPSGIAVSPTGNFAYVAQQRRDISPSTPRTVAVIDLQQNRMVSELIINASNTESILFSPNGSRAYFIEGTHVVVVDTANHSILARWQLGGAEFGFSTMTSMAVSADGLRLYVVADSSKRVHTVDTTTGNIVASFQYTNEPTSIVVDSAQQAAILLGNRTGLSTSVSLANGSVVKSFSIGEGPKASALTMASFVPAQQSIDNGGSSGGGGGCGYISGSGGPPDPMLPALAALALLTIALRRRARQR